MYQFTIEAIASYFGKLPLAIAHTLELSILTILLGLVLGIGGALCRTSRAPVLRLLGRVYVELLRNLPLLIVIYLVYFGLAQLGLRIGNFESALIALTLNTGAYMTEVLRGGLAAIDRGQYLAARAQAMSTVQVYRYVVFPQMFRIIYAPLGNLFISVVLGSSLASVIGVEDVMTWVHIVGNESFRYLEAFLVGGAVYVSLAQLINLSRLLVGRALLRHQAPGARA
ncbi:MAG TPA: amino acid ABC transporter permease [Stellaceae bacterium]|nr:amino acid ABC transporter permease [Stellaceae bacterium]